MPGSTERVSRLRELYMTTTPSIDSERAVLVTRVYQENENEPVVIKRAKALQKIYNEMTIFIQDGQLLAGNQTRLYRGGPMFPEYGLDWLINELDTGVFHKRTQQLEKQQISKEDEQSLRDIFDYWKGKRVPDYYNKAVPDGTKEVLEGGVLTFIWPIISPTYPGHCLPNYRKILEKGFLGIKKDAEAQIQKLGIRKEGRDIEKYHFLKAVVMVCEAGANYGKRYAALLRKKAASESDPEKKQEILKIAENCEWVPANPARTFWEACQSFWFLQMMLLLELDIMGLSPGRLDQYLYPYYKKDIEEGRLTKDQAQELIECLWIKLSELIPMKSERGAMGAGGYSTGQNVIIGGQTVDGRDATNDVTFMCLNATANLLFHDPPLSIRIWDGTPDALWNHAIEVTKLVGGMPSFQNDEVIIPQLINCGKSLEDARNYAIVGCVEPASPGNSFPCCGGAGSPSFLNLPQILLLALNNGVNPMNGKQSGLKTGDLSTYKSFEELKEAYIKQVEFYTDWHVTITNTCETVTRQIAPTPLLSMVIDDCVERGMDVMAGGARYNSIGTTGVGTSNVADALAGIKKFVYEDKKYTGAELLEAVKTNWEGREAMRHEIMNGAAKYGNDIPEVDELARWSTSVFTKRINESVGTRGPFRAGLWPVTAHLMMGKHTAATLDGRKAGDALADGISPRQGMDKNGPTAIFKSAAALDQFICYNGTLLNMKFHPNAVRGPEGTVKLKNLIQAYFDMKGMHIQLNVVSGDTLRDAQKNPDQYRNLVVRVAGYSAFFVELYKDTQDDIIARTELSV